jgi:hypothetical protein
VEAGVIASFTFCNFEPVIRFLIILIALLGSKSWGGNYFPFPIEDKFLPGREWQSYRAVQSLSGYWTDDQGKEWRVPFWENRLKELGLSYSFRLKPDSLNYFLCFEGIGWKAAIYLNGRLLLIHEKPFEGLLLPLKQDWLQEQGNVLRVELMNSGATVAPGLQKSLGIHREVWILTQADSVIQKNRMTWDYQSDSVIVYTPFTEENWYNVSSERLRADLEDMEYAGVKKVYFSMEPSGRVLEAFLAAGYTRVFSLAGAKKIAWFNAFPLSREVYFSDKVFWKTENGKPTAYFGKWFNPSDASECQRNRDNLFVLILFLIPMVGLVIFRLLQPQWFALQIRWLYTRRLELEMIGNRKFLRPVENSLITVVRIAITSSSIALYLYYLQLNCVIPTAAFLSGADSWVHQVLVSDWNPLFIWMLVFGWEMSLLFFRLILISFISSVFRIPWLQRIYLDINILSSFPLVIFLPTLALYLLYAPVRYESSVEVLALSIGFIYFARQIILLAAGLTQQFRFTPLLIFLYICTFEILPWLLIF